MTAAPGPVTRSRLVLGLAAAGIVMVAIQFAIYLAEPGQDSFLEVLGGVAVLGSQLAFVASGTVILVRQPGNPIGWLLILPGVSLPASEIASAWLVGMQPPSHFTPLTWLLAWWTSWSWVLLVFPIFHLLLVFPSGRLLSPRWRLVVALEALMISTLVLLSTFGAELGASTGGVPVWSLPNPIGFIPGDALDSPFGVAWALGLVSITILSGLALVLRFRRGTADERLQLKWPLFGAVVFGLIYVGSAAEIVISGDRFAFFQSLLGFGLAAIPITVAIAVLRYHLYDIDRIISRTIAWTVVSGILVAGFALGIVALQAILTNVTQRETLAVAASTLAAFAVAQPLLRRVQSGVDRRFNRARYDTQRTVDAFGERLRGQVAMEAVAHDLQATIEVAVRPASQGLWLREAVR